MHEFTYEISSFWIAAFLFASMALAIGTAYLRAELLPDFRARRGQEAVTPIPGFA